MQRIVIVIVMIIIAMFLVGQVLPWSPRNSNPHMPVMWVDAGGLPPELKQWLQCIRDCTDVISAQVAGRGVAEEGWPGLGGPDRNEAPRGCL